MMKLLSVNTLNCCHGTILNIWLNFVTCEQSLIKPVDLEGLGAVRMYVRAAIFQTSHPSEILYSLILLLLQVYLVAIRPRRPQGSTR